MGELKEKGVQTQHTKAKSARFDGSWWVNSQILVICEGRVHAEDRCVRDVDRRPRLETKIPMCQRRVLSMHNFLSECPGPDIDVTHIERN